MNGFRRGAVRRGWLIAAGVGLLVLLIASRQTCLRTGFGKGLWLSQCPDGELRQTISLSAPNLARGKKSYVNVRVLALYVPDGAENMNSEPITSFTPTLSLVGPNVNTPIPVREWKRSGDSLQGFIDFPVVNDGDYQLHVNVSSRIAETSLDVPTPLYTPARVHVLTDRPLYEPGNTVKFRALALKSSDLTPLDGRPGVWIVRDPSGEVLLEERAPAGAWGVVAGSFPLDAEAASGTWNVTWTSGATSETRSFDVRPFTLPRFRVEASSEKPFYKRLEKPSLKGEVRYSSGAPVAQAKVELSWTVQGAWPAPASWTEGTAFPKSATTDASGSFHVELPAVLEDLQGKVTLSVALAATDPAGDRVEGHASILLSEDSLAVDAMTELAGGLVEGFNNRLYLRATTADGRQLPGAMLTVKRLWEPTDKGTEAQVDEDGVASLQVDPGPPVNVVVPAMPFRPPAKAKAVTRLDASDQLNPDSEVSLADRLVFDRSQQKLETCVQYVASAGMTQLDVVLAINGGGKVFAVSVIAGRLGDCVRKQLEALAFSPGNERLIQVGYQLNDEDLPRLNVTVNAVNNDSPEVEVALQKAVLSARECLPSTIQSGVLPKLALWKHDVQKNELTLTWVADRQSGATKVGGSVQSCVEGKLSGLKLAKRPAAEVDAEEDDGAPSVIIGTAQFEVTAPEKYESVRPQPTIKTGYEFLISAKSKGEALGSTKLFVNPGQIPTQRLRATSQLVKPNQEVKVELLRGPDFVGDLPEKLYLSLGLKTIETKVDQEARAATFKIPESAEGWASVQWGSAMLYLFVQPKASLEVALKPDKERYAPGQIAQLGVETMVGTTGRTAAVGLFGVDESLAQLAPLPGPDELNGLRPQVTSSGSLGGLDAQALSLGRIRGANAIAATLLKVSALPSPPQVESPVAVSGQTVFDQNEALVDRFYAVLAELHLQTREWEASAPKSERMTNRTMATLWAKALTAVEKHKESTLDAFGRPLRLHRLPADLLALTEPRQVVVDGTRLPEDTVNWAAWVAKEKP